MSTSWKLWQRRPDSMGWASAAQDKELVCVVTPQAKTYHRNRHPLSTQHCLLRNKHSRLLSNYFGLINAIINLSKAFFSLVNQTCFVRAFIDLLHHNRCDKIFLGDFIKGPTCFWIGCVSWWETEPVAYLSLQEHYMLWIGKWWQQ